jgi:hypothetical protein
MIQEIVNKLLTSYSKGVRITNVACLRRYKV